VLQDIDLAVYRGQSLGVIGENGAGKSTLLKTIAGVIVPTTGTVRVNGKVGALLELGAGFHPEYYGRENIRLAAALLGFGGAELDAKLPAIIAFADIGDYIDEPIKHYSSGMVVRLGFAIITAVRPDLLITDEVLAVGDESFQKKCIRWMEDYLTQGGTLLLCSHSMFHIQKLCQKACWLQHGWLHRYGDAFQVTQAYLAYHEAKEGSRQKPGPEGLRGDAYRLVNLQLTGEKRADPCEIVTGDHLQVSGYAYAPDDRAPVVAVGIIRAGSDIPVYGVTSDMDGFTPNRLRRHRFGFSLTLRKLALLPGNYIVRAHALDPEGLRVFDTQEQGFTVTGTTRELGFCRLPHVWEPHREASETSQCVPS
jgi:lipopolysaccharide transport system ATP-binding protein